MSRRIIYVLWFGRMKVVCNMYVLSKYIPCTFIFTTNYHCIFLTTLRSRKAEDYKKEQKQIQKFFD